MNDIKRADNAYNTNQMAVRWGPAFVTLITTTSDAPSEPSTLTLRNYNYIRRNNFKYNVVTFLFYINDHSPAVDIYQDVVIKSYYSADGKVASDAYLKMIFTYWNCIYKCFIQLCNHIF